MRYHCATPALKMEVLVCSEKIAYLRGESQPQIGHGVPIMARELLSHSLKVGRIHHMIPVKD